jgi:hypothetical protein
MKRGPLEKKKEMTEVMKCKARVEECWSMERKTGETALHPPVRTWTEQPRRGFSEVKWQIGENKSAFVRSLVLCGLADLYVSFQINKKL